MPKQVAKSQYPEVAGPQPLPKLSSAQARVLRALRTMIRDQGYSPTHREVAEYLEVSRQFITKTIGQLESHGLIHCAPGLRTTVMTARGERILRKLEAEVQR